MRIAIDASRTTLARRTGTENYALQLIRALLTLNSRRSPAFDITLYFRDAPTAPLGPANYRVLPAKRLWTHRTFAAALRRDKPNVTFVPAHTLPLSFPGRAVVTVHDLGYRYFPQAHPFKERLYLNLTTRYSANRAAHILADSQATKRDLITYYNVNADKVTVVYPGVEGIFRAGDARIAAMRAKYGLANGYFLFLGTLQPRKNIQRLCQAYAQWLKTSGDTDTKLVLAGGQGWLLNVQRDVLTGLPEQATNNIVMPGYIPDEDVPALYSGALALVFPSLYEGFGFPVVEAMRCGTPVICANTSSLPELAGNAALLVDPLKVGEIAEAMGRISSDNMLRAELVERGYRQSAQFTWERAAHDTMAILGGDGAKGEGSPHA